MIRFKIQSCRHHAKFLASFCTSPPSTSQLEILYQKSKQAKTPFFTTQSHLIKIINDPLDFYMSLYTQTKNSAYRIGLSSLYMGTGPLERFLFQNIVKRAKSTPSLEVKMVFDYNRSLRIQKGQSSVQMFNFYRESELRERIKISLNKQSASMNKLFGEISGVHHQKIAVFDDTVIIGGANLSHNYFVNRKDRYFMIKGCPDLADYLYDYLRVLEQNCYEVIDDYAKKSQLANLTDHYKLWRFSYSPEQYKETLPQQEQYLMKKRAQKQIEQARSFTLNTPKPQKGRNIQLAQILGSDVKVYEPLPAQEIIRKKQNVRQKLFGVGEESDVGNAILEIQNINDGGQVEEVGQKVYIFPFIHFPQIGEVLQPKVFKEVLENATNKKIPIRLSSGYMNFTPQILKTLSKSEIPTEILCSAPQANSFFRAGKFKKYIPYFYRNIEGRILTNYPQNFVIKQYSDGRWSFHAKGVWIKQSAGSYLTVIGSSNYNYRSKSRDTQLQLYLYSTCQKFNKKLDKEWENIETCCKKVTIEDIKADKEIKFGGVFTLLTKMFERFL